MTGEQPAMQVGKRVTVEVSYTLERTVEGVVMPVDGDAGEQADLKLFLEGEFDDFRGERDVVHSRVVEKEPMYEDEFDSEEDWPSYV